jgi:predicted secreted hydrolase
LSVTLAPLAVVAADDEAGYPLVERGRVLRFPRDFGSHPEYRVEWWYITGWLQRDNGTALGVQITFFRHRPRIGEESASRFAPRELLFAHAALADPGLGRLRHDQRAARAGFDLAGAREDTTDVHIGDWSLRREANGYVANIPAARFTLALQFAPTQPPLLQGEAGYSRKGPAAHQASYYYSEPHLTTKGEISIEKNTFSVTGNAWCDHEWSSEYMPAQAAGWDWAGINLADGGALMAFVMRDRAGGVLWAGGSVRTGDGAMRAFGEHEVRLVSRRSWRSPRTQAVYPVAMTLQIGTAVYTLEPLFDDQELDARGSTGTIYWEGAVRALVEGREIGLGYLELTGYAGRLRL